MRLDNKQPLETVTRKELVAAVKELGWRLAGRCTQPDGCDLVCIWDGAGRYQGTLRVRVEESVESLVP